MDLLAQADWLGSKGRGRPALVLYSSNEPGELSHWPCHDDSTVNIVVAITAITKTRYDWEELSESKQSE